MSLKHGILGLLQYGPMTAYSLTQTFKDSLKFFWDAQSSQIYREANMLEELALATSTEEIQSGKPNKRVYCITDLGRKEFISWLEKAHDNEDDIRSAFTMRIFFLSRMEKKSALSLLVGYKNSCKKKLESLNNAKELSSQYSEYGEVTEQDPLGWKLSIMYGAYQYKASLEWAEEAIKLISETQEQI